MSFHTNCGILLVLCAVKYTMKQCVAEDISMNYQNGASDEEDAIKEALLLVELLKNAQEKDILRTINTPVEESTCGITNSEGFTPPEHKGKSSSINPETTTEASMPPTEEFPHHRRALVQNWPTTHLHHDYYHPRDEPNEDYYRPRGFFRRRFPDDFYFQNYFDFPRVNKENTIPGFRRFQNDKMETITSSSDKTTATTVSSLTTTTKFDKKTKRLEKKSQPIVKPVAMTTTKIKPSSLSTKGPLSTNAKTTLETTKKQQKLTTKRKESQDSLIDEITSELLKELNGSKIVDKVINKVTKTKTETFRTTLKMYLDGSTRYNIPFPENHSFCFTNPESWLCRTP